VTEELRLHWALHEIDEQAVACEQVLAKHPEQRRAQEARIASARAALAALDQRTADSSRRRRTLDGEIAAFEAQQKHFERQLLAVTNQHQFEAAQHEIAAVRAKRDVLETEVLERLDVEERDAAGRPEKAHALERAETEGAALFAKLDAESARSRAELATLDARRAETAGRLEPAIDVRGIGIVKRKGGRANFATAADHAAEKAIIARLEEHDAGIAVLAEESATKEARRAERLLTCDGCGRLLVMPPEPSTPA